MPKATAATDDNAASGVTKVASTEALAALQRLRESLPLNEQQVGAHLVCPSQTRVRRGTREH